jgi:hypothetical protein
MAKKEIKQSYSSFSKNPELNRARHVRRDDDVIRTPKCTIEDVDWAIMSYIQDIIKPQVKENNARIDVPVMYANGEKWAQIQAKGYMRDRKGKLMTPIITIRRNSITERDQLKKLDVNQNPDGNAQLLQNKHTKINRYDRFSVLQNAKPMAEYYIGAIPEYIDVAYELLLWTEYTEQMNSLVEQIMPTGGFAWGTTFKFPTFISDYTFETLNASGEDRLVRATIPMTTKATLLMPEELRKSTIQKRYSIKRIKFDGEYTSDNSNIINTPPGGYNK